MSRLTFLRPPQDPLLFNRLGATYANSGKTDAAMQYYHAALDLDPGYVRARYNLAVACMNVGVGLLRLDECVFPEWRFTPFFRQKHEDAVHHLLTSLSIQEADSELDSEFLVVVVPELVFSWLLILPSLARLAARPAVRRVGSRQPRLVGYAPRLSAPVRFRPFSRLTLAR
jgi:tetratricopeptide (TPR) repeat protein